MAMFPQWNDPGATAVVESGEAAFIQNAFGREMLLLTKIGTIVSTTTDASNTPTTTLRKGLILGIITATGKYGVYDPTLTNGLQIPRAILPVQLNMLNQAGVAADKTGPLITRANLMVAQIPNYDVQAGRALIQLGFVLDAPAGAQAPVGSPIGTQDKGADYTVTAADCGIRFHAITGAVNFTLPTKAVGLWYEFFNTVDAAMAILSASSSDDIITDGDAGADSITYGTSSHKIGSFCRVDCRYVGGALKWFASNLGGTTQTIA